MLAALQAYHGGTRFSAEDVSTTGSELRNGFRDGRRNGRRNGWVDGMGLGMGEGMGLRVGFININYMYNNYVGKGVVYAYEAYEAK